MRLHSRVRARLRSFGGSGYVLNSYSQEGEDLVLRRLLGDEKKTGFYVDIGAHHPERFSNTAYYSKKGWTGINVDADPELIEVFKRERPRDINLAFGVGQHIGVLDLYVFNEKALNTFDKKIALERSKIQGYRILTLKRIKVLPLKKIIKRHLPKGQKIDFMSVDVEGKDLDVLKSNDWSVCRPRIVITECLKVDSLLEIREDPVVRYMSKHGYVPIAKTLYSIFFKDASND